MRLANLFRRRASTRNQELDEEIQAHLRMAVQDLIESGKREAEAWALARREFGNIALVKETARAVWIRPFIDTLVQDLRYALRGMKRSPAFTFFAVGSLALGIGANTAIFSLVDTLLLKQLPVPNPERLVRFSDYFHGKLANTVFSYEFLNHLDRGNDVFDGLLGRFPVRASFTASDSAQPVTAELVTGDYFRTLGVAPAAGRLLTPQDIQSAAGNPVCVISYAAWQQHFGGDPKIVGRKVLLNSHPYTVVGVTRPGFYGTQLDTRADMQIPLSRAGDFMSFLSSSDGGMAWDAPDFRWLEPLARLKPGLTIAQAQAALAPAAEAIETQLEHPNRKLAADDKASFRLAAASQGTEYDERYQKPALVLMAIVGLVLLIACANLSGLLLARAASRAREFAIRLSLGASRARIVRQVFIETFAISILGAVFGLLVAAWMDNALVAYLNLGRSQGQQIAASMSVPVICFAMLISLCAALLSGLVPALQSSKPEILPELKGSSGIARGGSFQPRAASTSNRFLIVFQVALSLVILFAAGLLIQSLSHLQALDLGFDPSHVISARIDPAMNGYSRADGDRIFSEIVTRLRAQPAIAAASFAVVIPLSGSMICFPIDVPGHIPSRSDLQADINTVSSGYFETLEQRFLSGRDFDERDTRNAPRVAIVNKQFAVQYFQGRDPVGRYIDVQDARTRIIGFVDNARYQTLRESLPPLVYLPAAQTESSGYTLLVRTRAAPRGVLRDIERTVRSVAPRLPLYDVHDLEINVQSGMSAERVLSFLSMLFSLLVTALCAMGIYGLISCSVARRTREIGIRIAVGAGKADVALLFLRDSGVLIGTGLLVGIPLALASGRLLQSMLFGVNSGDAVTLAIVLAFFIAAGLIATALPVRRAIRIEPVGALRYE
jgi:predicted permease